MKKFQVIRGCTFCGTCVDECPVSAIVLSIEGAVIDQNKCTGCGICMDNCASEAIVPVDCSVQQPAEGQ